MNPAHEFHILQNRRQFFQGAGLKAGGIALASMLGRQASGDVSKPVNMYPALSGFPHFAPKAKRLVYLHMNGAPSSTFLITSHDSTTTLIKNYLTPSVMVSESPR